MVATSPLASGQLTSRMADAFIQNRFGDRTNLSERRAHRSRGDLEHRTEAKTSTRRRCAIEVAGGILDYRRVGAPLLQRIENGIPADRTNLKYYSTAERAKAVNLATAGCVAV